MMQIIDTLMGVCLVIISLLTIPIIIIGLMLFIKEYREENKRR